VDGDAGGWNALVRVGKSVQIESIKNTSNNYIVELGILK